MTNLFTITRKDGSGVIIWSEDQKRFIINEYQNKNNTLKAIAEMFQVRPEAIRNLLRKENIPITNKQTQKYPRNSNFFDVIDTPQKAYWLGMFYADGCVKKNNQITLGLKDLEHVEKFKQAIAAINNKIITIEDKRLNKIYYRYDFTIRDKQLHDSLIKQGVLVNKSYENFGLPQLLNLSLMRHFIRGYYDGDGGLTYKINYDCPSKSHFKVSFTGNQQFLNELKCFLNRDKISLQQNSISKITYDFSISGRQQVLSFLSWLYQDSDEFTRLDRKYNKYLELSSYEAPHPRTRKCEVWPTI